MKVFLSWSGDRSRAVAAALHAWLEDVVHEVKPWMSQKDVFPGSPWFESLAKQLPQTSFGIICLTPENGTSPWLHFEAGALFKSIDTVHIIPYCFDLDPSSVAPPLNAFQGIKANKEGTERLVKTVNSRLIEPVSEERLSRMFELCWPDLEKKLSSVPKISGPRVTVLEKIYCAYTQPFEAEGAEEDAKILETCFPKKTLVRRRVTKTQLERDLSTGKFEIVHLVLLTDPRSGDVFFDEASNEKIRPDGLRQLLTRCQVKLICLATCHSTVLGAYLSKVATTIAAYGETPGKAWVEWEQTFYGQLSAGLPTYDAYDLAQASSEEPMTLHRNQDAIFHLDS